MSRMRVDNWNKPSIATDDADVTSMVSGKVKQSRWRREKFDRNGGKLAYFLAVGIMEIYLYTTYQ